MSEIEIEGKTVEEAISEGLKQLNCPREQVEIKILNEGANGLFGLMGNKPARVLLKIKNGESNANIDYNKTQEETKKVLATLLKLMNFSYKNINTAMVTGRILAEIKSDDSRFIIGKNGATLDALEHILNLILHKNEETRAKVNLDAEGYRAQQESRLQTLALKGAEQAKTSGKPYKFDPMNAKERRLIHLFLKNNPDVEAVSEGEGFFRRVVLKPKN